MCFYKSELIQRRLYNSYVLLLHTFDPHNLALLPRPSNNTTYKF